MAMAAQEIGRSPERLREECKLVERALRLRGMAPDDAEAYASKGARYGVEPPSGPRSRFADAPPPPARDFYPPPRHSQRFEGDVIRLLDKQLEGIPLHVFRRLPALVVGLPFLERWVVELAIRRGMSYRDVIAWRAPWGRTLGMHSPTTVGNVKARALEWLACQCWDDDGAPIFG